MATETSHPETADDRTVSFISLGCPKNLVDSEKMLGMLAEHGVRPVAWEGSADDRWDDSSDVEGGDTRPDVALHAPPAIQSADAVVINTCGFLEASKEESLQTIREAVAAKKEGRVGRVVVAGCLVQRHRAKLLEWEPEIDALLGVFDRDRVVSAVLGPQAEREELPAEGERPNYWIAASALQAAEARGRDTVGLTVNGKDGKGVGYFESDSARVRLTPRHYAYLRISEGCNQNCAFCTIPSIRGKMRSKPLEAIEAEARELVRDGAFELNLIGQDTTSFGDDIGMGWNGDKAAGSGGLPELLQRVCRAAEEEARTAWVRLMYAYPSNFRDEFIDDFARLCRDSVLIPYIDIPLQHASDAMLTRMRRNVSAEHQRELMHRLRDRIEGLAIRTTFISGFPGETEEDHQQLLAFVEEVGFDAVGVFEYSAEAGTPAARMEQDPALAVDPETKTRRKGEILALQQELAFEQADFLAEQFDPAEPETSGCRFDVLIDRAASEIEIEGMGEGLTVYQGRTAFQAPRIDAVTYVASRSKLSSGELVPATIVASAGYDLVARPVDEILRRISLPLA